MPTCPAATQDDEFTGYALALASRQHIRTEEAKRRGTNEPHLHLEHLRRVDVGERRRKRQASHNATLFSVSWYRTDSQSPFGFTLKRMPDARSIKSSLFAS